MSRFISTRVKNRSLGEEKGEKYKRGWYLEVRSTYQERLGVEVINILASHDVHVSSFKEIVSSGSKCFWTFKVKLPAESKMTKDNVKDEFFANDLDKFIDRVTTQISRAIPNESQVNFLPQGQKRLGEGAIAGPTL